MKLTSKGHSLVDEALTEHIDNEQRLLSSVTPAEQRRLATMLRRLLGVLEASPSGRGGSQHDADQAAKNSGSSLAGRPGLATRAASG